MENRRELRERLISAIEEYTVALGNVLKIWWNNQTIDPSNKIEFEVIGGLFSRHISLTTKFLRSNLNWDVEIGTIVLRSICENYITTAWILKESPIERCEKYVEYGLGQMKLMHEKYKEEIEKQIDKADGNEEFLKTSKNIIDNEKYNFLLDVNVGSWNGIRKMAIEADCKDFYDFVFSPFSESAHGTWSHVMRFNLIEVNDPLAMNIKKPYIRNSSPDFQYAELTIKYMDKFISKIEDVYGKLQIENPSLKFYETIDNLNENAITKK